MGYYPTSELMKEDTRLRRVELIPQGVRAIHIDNISFTNINGLTEKDGILRVIYATEIAQLCRGAVYYIKYIATGFDLETYNTDNKKEFVDLVYAVGNCRLIGIERTISNIPSEMETSEPIVYVFEILNDI